MACECEDNNCGCEQILVPAPPSSGVPGPQGPTGPQGPAGPGVELPLPASDISVTNPGYANLQELLNFLAYVPVTINSFDAALTVYEIGSSISNINFIWNLSANPASQSISGPNLTPPSLAVTDRNITAVLSSPLVPSVVGSSYDYQLSVYDGYATVIDTVSLTFLNNVYFGDAPAPGAINSAFINTLSKALQSNRSRVFDSNAGASTYAWFAHREALGTAVFSVGGFIGGFEAPVTVSVTNSSGFTENYKVYRSTNPNIGPVTITVA
jgi:hypothetical protein